MFIKFFVSEKHTELVEGAVSGVTLMAEVSSTYGQASLVSTETTSLLFQYCIVLGSETFACLAISCLPLPDYFSKTIQESHSKVLQSIALVLRSIVAGTKICPEWAKMLHSHNYRKG